MSSFLDSPLPKSKKLSTQGRGRLFRPPLIWHCWVLSYYRILMGGENNICKFGGSQFAINLSIHFCHYRHRFSRHFHHSFSRHYFLMAKMAMSPPISILASWASSLIANILATWLPLHRPLTFQDVTVVFGIYPMNCLPSISKPLSVKKTSWGVLFDQKLLSYPPPYLFGSAE